MPRVSEIRKCSKEAATRKLAAKGLTYRQIADELLKQGCKVSHVAVGRFLLEETSERREAARSVASSEAKESVPLVTSTLRGWVETIARLVNRTQEATERELAELAIAGDDDDSTPRKRAERRSSVMRGSSQSIATLVQAGTKAAKTLHDITVGEDPSTGVEDLRGEVLGILAAKQKRDRPEDD